MRSFPTSPFFRPGGKPQTPTARSALHPSELVLLVKGYSEDINCLTRLILTTLAAAGIQENLCWMSIDPHILLVALHLFDVRCTVLMFWSHHGCQRIMHLSLILNSCLSSAEKGILADRNRREYCMHGPHAVQSDLTVPFRSFGLPHPCCCCFLPSCDRRDASCVCADGFEGDACQRSEQTFS